MAYLGQVTPPIFALHGIILVHVLSYTYIYSLLKGTIIEKHVVDPNKKANKIFCDLNYLDWYLEWGKADVQSDTLVSLALKFVPQPEFADKLSSMLIMLGFTIHCGDLDKPVAYMPLRNTVQLTKEMDYRFKIVHGKKKLPHATNDQSVLCNVSLSNFNTHIGCQVAILYMHTFLDKRYTWLSSCLSQPNIIGKDLKAVLSFSGTEKRSNFNDVSLVVKSQENERGQPSTS